MSRNITVGITRFLKATELRQRQDLEAFFMLVVNSFIAIFNENASI